MAGVRISVNANMCVFTVMLWQATEMATKAMRISETVTEIEGFYDCLEENDVDRALPNGVGIGDIERYMKYVVRKNREMGVNVMYRFMREGGFSNERQLSLAASG